MTIKIVLFIILTIKAVGSTTRTVLSVKHKDNSIIIGAIFGALVYWSCVLTLLYFV